MESVQFNEQSLATLHEYAVPTKGGFKEYIGTVIFASANHPVRIMTQTGTVVSERKKEYNMIQGYIHVMDIVNGYIAGKPKDSVKVRRIGDWGRSKKSVRILQTGSPSSISIEGSHEIQGTYFHSSIVLDVILWVCPSYIEEVKEGYCQTIIQLNQDRHSMNPIQSEERKDEVRDAIADLNRNYVLAFDRETMAAQEIIQRHPSINPSQSEEEEKTIKPDASAYQTLLCEIQKITESRDLAKTNKDWQAFAELQEVLDSLIVKKEEYLLQGAGRKGQLYVLKWRSDNSPFYCGISEAKGSNGIESFLHRFKGHKQESIKLFSQSDLVHIKMAGVLADYMIENNITQYHTDLFDKICYTERLPVETMDRRTLEDIEGETVRKLIQEGHKMFNTAKRAERIRSNSSSVRSESRSISRSRLESLQMTAKAAKQGEVDKKLQAIEETEEEKKSVERIIPKVGSNQQNTPITLTNVKNSIIPPPSSTMQPPGDQSQSLPVPKPSKAIKRSSVNPPQPQAIPCSSAGRPALLRAVDRMNIQTAGAPGDEEVAASRVLLADGRVKCGRCNNDYTKQYFPRHQCKGQ